MKIRNTIISLSALLLTGCSYHSSINQVRPSLAPINTNIHYELVADAHAIDEKCFMFGLGNPFAEEFTASVPIEGASDEENRKFNDINSTAGMVAYKALASVPDADALFSIRWNSKREFWWPVFYCDTIEIQAKAIRYYQPGVEEVKEEMAPDIPEPIIIDPSKSEQAPTPVEEIPEKM